MKRLRLAIAVLLAAGIARAEMHEITDAMTIAEVSGGTYTQAVDSATNAWDLTGDVTALAFDFAGYASPTVNVSVATTTDRFGFSRLLYTNAAMTTDGVKLVRFPAVTSADGVTTNSPVLAPLYVERIVLKAYGANSTGIVLKAWAIIE